MLDLSGGLSVVEGSGWLGVMANVLIGLLALIVLGLAWHTFNFVKTYLEWRHTPGHVSFFPAVIDAMIHKRIYVHHQYCCTLAAFQKYPDAKVVKIQFGAKAQLMLARDQALIREIFIKKYKTISKGDVLAKVGLFGPNMFSADSMDPVWKKHRTLSNPIFSGASHLRNVFRVTKEEMKKMLNFWKKIYKTDEDGSMEKVNVTNEFKSVTLSVINRVAFDYDMQIFEKTVQHRDELHEWVTNLLTGLIYTFVFPSWAFEYLPFGIFKKFRDAKERFRNATLNMIEKKQKDFEASEGSLRDDEDLLTLLLKSSSEAKEEDKLSKDELLSAIFIVFFAGFETSSASLNFMLRMLAKHQDVQDKMVKEIDESIKSIDDITFEVITDKLPYTTSFMKEVLRTKTAVGGGARIINKKGGEVINGIRYPKGTPVTVSYYSQHYFAKDGGLDFKPDRFLDTNKTNSTSESSEQATDEYDENFGKGPMGELNIDFNKEQILPFSIGPRDCIGRRMALLEMKLILVLLLKQYRLKVPEGLEEQQDKIEETYIVTRTVFEPYLIDFIARK